MIRRDGCTLMSNTVFCQEGECQALALRKKTSQYNEVSCKKTSQRSEILHKKTSQSNQVSEHKASSKRETVLSSRGVFVAQDGGFTSVGVAIALLLSMALLFSAAQVRWIQSQSADIQFVADAGALAGGNVVGEYMVIARVADAVVLSLSLLGMATYGIAIVVSCIPSLQSVGAELMQFGSQVFKARDNCAKTAATALNKLQAALPFLIALNAAAAIEANANISGSPAAYHGIAFPLPLSGEEISYPSDDAAEQSAETLTEQNKQTHELTDAAHEASEKMEASKLEAYLADCGNSPGHCLYERASKLAGLSGSSNPYVSSVDTWLFDYAFARAKSYYAERLSLEKPASQALDEQVRSHCRQRFYAYAVGELRGGWCKTSPDGVLDAYFPLLPKNTDEVRQSTLYTESAYPLSADGVLHGASACPAYQAAGAAGSGSVSGLEAGSYASCNTCEFSASDIGKVASASTSIDNGFEHHYRIVAEAAKNYQTASETYEKESKAAKDSASKSFDIFEEAMQALKTPRIKPRPPGHNGVIALVFDTEAHAIPAGFTNSLVEGSAELQPRVAISAAALAEEKADDGGNILASFLDRVKADTGQSTLALASLGAFDGILEIWGSALLVYSRGGDAISEGLTQFLDAIPLVRATPLSRWAKTALSDTVNALGLEGASLDTPKPLLVNSVHVLRSSDSAPAKALLLAKEAYSSWGGSGSGTLGGAFAEGLPEVLSDSGAELLESEFTLFEISFGDDPRLPKIPITVHLPDNLVSQGQGLVDGIASAVSSGLSGGGNREIWE